MTSGPRAGAIFTGALIVVAMRWTDRLVGLCSTLILARMLLPEDFGIISMASIIVGLVDVLLDLGVTAALIHKKECDADDYSTAWTVRLLQSALVAGVIVALAPFAADYYGDGRVTPVLRLMALSTLVAGLENIGVVAFQKEMRFGSDFRFLFLRRLAGFFATIALAWWLQDYWALPLGALAGRAAGVGLSYGLHPFRPRLTLARFQGIWSFSQWMLVRSIGTYVDGRLDKLLLGHRVDAAVVGAYTLADEIAMMPSRELLSPIGRVLFPAFVEVRNQPEALRRAYLLALAAQAIIAIPCATGLALVAREAVLLLLGERWLNAVPFVQLLALVYGLNALSHAAGYLLLTVGRVRAMALFIWIQILLFAAGALSFLADGQALALAQWRLAVAVAGTLGFLWLVLKEVPTLAAGDLVAVIWRPLAAAGAMATVLSLLPVDGWPPLLCLLARALGGAAVYGAVLLGLWAVAGRPPGGEAFVVDKFGTLLARRP